MVGRLMEKSLGKGLGKGLGLGLGLGDRMPRRPCLLNL